MLSTTSLCKNALLLNLAIEPLQSSLERLMLANFYFRHQESLPSWPVFEVGKVTPSAPYILRDLRKDYSVVAVMCQDFLS